MRVSEKQKYLIQCCRAYGMDKEMAIGVMSLLTTEDLQNEMLEWMKNHTTENPEEVLRNAWRMKGLI